MPNIPSLLTDRRELIRGLATTLVSLSTPSICRASVLRPNNQLLETCIFAWQDARAAEGRIDFWTAQLGMVDAFALPASARLIVMWGDVCSNRTVDSRIWDTKRAIGDYFDIAVCEDGSNSATFIEEKKSLSEVLGSVCGRCSTASTAVVDVASTGMCRTDWPDIIPLLKQSYEKVVGVDYAVPELISLDSDFRAPGCPTDARSWNSLTACDAFSIVSDELLSPDPIDCYEKRAELYTAHVSGLIADLSNECGNNFF